MFKVRETMPLLVIVAVMLTALPDSEASEVADEIMAIEARRMAAMIEVNEQELNRLLAHDLTYAHSNGIVQSKADLVASLVEGRFDYESIAVEDASVRVLGQAAVVTGVAVVAVVAREQRVKLRLRYTLVYAKRDAGWQMVAYQSTRLGLVE